MFTKSKKASEKTATWLIALVVGVVAGGGVAPALAQGSSEAEMQMMEEVVVTGSRIRRPGLTSSSPITSVEAEEIEFSQEVELEKILRDLPSTIPGDNENVNNGTGGYTSVDLRGLGPQRNLVLLNGRRVTPANHNGIVDLSSIPTPLIDRIDIITGGASAVYGADAIAGAVNVVLKNDFEGMDFNVRTSQTSESDAKMETVSLTLGSPLADDRGHVALSLSWADRKPLLLGERPLGRLGITTKAGGNLDAFNAGTAPPPSSISGCTGPNVAADGGSTTAIPTRAAIVGAGGVGQFLNDRTLYIGDPDGGDGVNDGKDTTLYKGPGGGCSVFNFNPYNYFRTPQDRKNLFVTANFDFSERFEAYSSLEFSHVRVEQQIAPSGTFGAAFMVPLANPFISDDARMKIIDYANARRPGQPSFTRPKIMIDGKSEDNLDIPLAPTGTAYTDANALVKTCVDSNGMPVDTDPDTPGAQCTPNWVDANDNGMVDMADTLNMQLRRRTLELGTRTENYDTEHFMLLAGGRGEVYKDWEYDASIQYGESNRTTVRGGYTNLTNIQNALNTTSRDRCTGVNDSTCVPIDLFGGFGTITSEMAAYATALALQQQKYEQTIFQLTFNGSINGAQLPTASEPLALVVGYEHRDEKSSLEPDECLKLAPSSCQGGAGGNLLPISGGFRVDEFLLEGYLPIVDGMNFAESLNFEFGYRSSDYTSVGSVDSWKAGFNWNVTDDVLVRIMQQQAIRAPNVAELASPITTGLDNAQGDPCAMGNSINATLRERCIASGQSDGQVGMLQDIVSGQINVISGSDPSTPPDAETADTFTLGVVWTPDFDRVQNMVLSLDYYDIYVEDVIGEYTAQEVLNQCFVAGILDVCRNQIRRVAGDFTSSASGILLYTTNLLYEEAKGIELSYSFGVDLGDGGNLQFSGQINRYLDQGSQSDARSPVVDCKGFYGTSCTPRSDFTWNNRVTWEWRENLTVSLQWKHLGSISAEPPERKNVFPQFQKIDSYNYFSLYGSYDLWDDRVTLSLGIENLTDEDPPIVGGEAARTAFNSGNTFPSNYDVYGTMYTAGFRVRL